MSPFDVGIRMSSVSLTAMTASGRRMSTVMKRNPARATSGVPWLSGGAFSDAMAVRRTWISGSTGMPTSSPQGARPLLLGSAPATQDQGGDEDGEQSEQQHGRDDDGNLPLVLRSERMRCRRYVAIRRRDSDQHREPLRHGNAPRSPKPRDRSDSG